MVASLGPALSTASPAPRDAGPWSPWSPSILLAICGKRESPILDPGCAWSPASSTRLSMSNSARHLALRRPGARQLAFGSLQQGADLIQIDPAHRPPAPVARSLHASQVSHRDLESPRGALKQVALGAEDAGLVLPAPEAQRGARCVNHGVSRARRQEAAPGAQHGRRDQVLRRLALGGLEEEDGAAQGHVLGVLAPLEPQKHADGGRVTRKRAVELPCARKCVP